MNINRMQQKQQRGKGKSQRVRDRQHAEGGRKKEAGKEREIMKIVQKLLCWVPIPEDVGTSIWWPQIGHELHQANQRLNLSGPLPGVRVTQNHFYNPWAQHQWQLTMTVQLDPPVSWVTSITSPCIITVEMASPGLVSLSLWSSWILFTPWL